MTCYLLNWNIFRFQIVELNGELIICGSKVTRKNHELVERVPAMNMRVNEFNSQNKRVAQNKQLNLGEVEQSPIILEMPVEVIEYILDYLNLKDLSAVSGTCRQMQQLAGRVYQQNYSGICPEIKRVQKDWILQKIPPHSESNQEIDFEHFIPFIDKMYVCCEKKLMFLNSGLQSNHIKDLILEVNLAEAPVDGLKEISNKIEHLTINCNDRELMWLGNFIAQSPNLIRLNLKLCINDETTSLERNYSNIEHIEIRSIGIIPITKILQANPNIRKFGCSSSNLWADRFSIKNTEVKLDELSIQVMFEPEPILVCQLLDELHQLGVYKRLNLFTLGGSIDQQFVDGISHICVLKRLRLHRNTYIDYVALSALAHLENIAFPDSRCITDIETIATKLANLKFVHFGLSDTNHVKLFMGGNPKLERIRIDWFVDRVGNIEDDKVLSLIELNNERATKLPNAKKVTLYVQEPIYLATKWASRETDLDFIKLKRIDTLNDRDFDFVPPVIYWQKPYYIFDRQ